jgi:RNA recognition motif-containing protein
MGTRLFVGNLSYTTTEQSLRAHFVERGWPVTDVVIVTERETGRSRGFGFVEFDGEEEARKARDALDGQEFEGRRLAIREAYERAPRGAPRGFEGPVEDRGGDRGPKPERSYDRGARPDRGGGREVRSFGGPGGGGSGGGAWGGPPVVAEGAPTDKDRRRARREKGRSRQEREWDDDW